MLGIVAALSFTVPAHAEPASDAKLDANFLDALQRAGVSFNNGATAVNSAKAACAMMNQGQPEIDVIRRVAEQNPGIDTTSAAKFTAIAASAYCPQHLQGAGGSQN
ncbi:DUF732 domain-containing protein [Mycobacterium cookii]|uniref:DUF732 domain-containing protein n=1 Tax=Mycobacterium cookii TaxID=1775 RepID=A0A7I7KRR9_9MYCO|nr:DUF732 domain-containing protein [Mycobacterium cookii]BBX44271.1 hypothetical protein MCOO_02860 [Mycobacterium cookii]